MLFGLRNLVYGDTDFIFSAIDKPYTIIAVGDYHDGYLLRRMDLFLFSDDVYFVPAYNREQLRKAIKLAMDLYLPTVIMSIHRLFGIEDFHELNNIIYPILNRYDETVVITTRPMENRRYPPEPFAPHYVRHMCDVVIYSRKVRGGYSIYIIKHPFLPYKKLYIPVLGGDLYGKKLSVFQRLT